MQIDNNPEAAAKPPLSTEGRFWKRFWHTDPGSGWGPTALQACSGLLLWLYLGYAISVTWKISLGWGLAVVAAAAGVGLVYINATYPGNRWSSIAKLPVILIGLLVLTLVWLIVFRVPHQQAQQQMDRYRIMPVSTGSSLQERVRKIMTAKASQEYWKEAVLPMLRLRSSLFLTADETRATQHPMKLSAFAGAIDSAAAVDITDVDPELVAMSKKHLEHDTALAFLANDIETHRTGKKVNERPDRPLGEIFGDLHTAVSQSRDSQGNELQQTYYETALGFFAGYNDIFLEAERMSARLEERYSDAAFPTTAAEDLESWRRIP